MVHIFIVDDDVYVREGLVAVLAAEGHSLTEAGSLKEAHETFTGIGSTVDMVLLDLWLPDGNGLRFLDHLKLAAPTMPVVVMSGGGPGRSLEQALAFADATGASASIIKPFQNSELIDKVNAVLGEV